MDAAVGGRAKVTDGPIIQSIPPAAGKSNTSPAGLTAFICPPPHGYRWCQLKAGGAVWTPPPPPIRALSWTDGRTEKPMGGGEVGGVLLSCLQGRVFLLPPRSVTHTSQMHKWISVSGLMCRRQDLLCMEVSQQVGLQPLGVRTEEEKKKKTK